MKSQTIEIENKLGIHARPASMIVQKAMEFEAELFLQHNETRVNGKSILSVMMLAAEKGTPITIIAEGKDENNAVEEIIKLFKMKFNED